MWGGRPLRLLWSRLGLLYIGFGMSPLSIRKFVLMLLISCVLGACTIHHPQKVPPSLVEKHFQDDKSATILGGIEIESTHPISQSSVFLMTTNYQGKKESCTGVLLHPQIALTAAHCALASQREFAAEIILIFASNIQQYHGVFPDRIQRKVHQVHIHPGYDFEKCQKQIQNCDDLALLEFSEPAPEGFLPATILSSKSSFLGEVWVTGYGQTEFQSSGTLRIAHRPLLSPLLPEAPIFTVNQMDKKGSCFGDSGGPVWVQDSLTRQYQLVGINAGVFPGCYGFSYFMNLNYYSAWISNEIILNPITK